MSKLMDRHNVVGEMAASFHVIEIEDHRAVELPWKGGNPPWRALFGLRGPRPMEILAKYFGLQTNRIATVRQVHGVSIWVVDAAQASDPSGPEREADAMITKRPGMAIAVRTADCLPILIWDEVNKVAAAVHAGWRGSLNAIASKAVLTMRSSFGSHPGDLRVGIGPAIGPCCYEVNGPVLTPLRERFGYWSEVVREKGNGKGMLDLAGLNFRQLVATGVPPEGITVAYACTFCHPERFYSFRRDGDSSGGMISGIMIQA
ncbi:MAG TPA: peptidoglycan editing factor PgeF [Nitrospiria bacterium]|jgi:YfiH family protein|nr:peptidoglycan editing factor PgeF [Nitrospiria bacterium]